MACEQAGHAVGALDLGNMARAGQKVKRESAFGPGGLRHGQDLVLTAPEERGEARERGAQVEGLDAAQGGAGGEAAQPRGEAFGAAGLGDAGEGGGVDLGAEACGGR